MKKQFSLAQMGTISAENGMFRINIAPEFRKAMTGMQGFSYIQVLYWLDRNDNDAARATIFSSKPYVKGPEELGVFATRSDYRPNPIALSVCMVTKIDVERGIVDLAYIDAENESPLLDIKPYHPAIDRVRDVQVPAWCEHWPKWYEDSAFFAWEKEFNFPM